MLSMSYFIMATCTTEEVISVGVMSKMLMFVTQHMHLSS